MLSPSFCGQESGCDLAGWLWFSLQSVGQGCGWRLHWGSIHFQVQPCALRQDSAPWGWLHWGPRLFAGSWLETSLSSLPRSLSTGYVQPHPEQDRETHCPWSEKSHLRPVHSHRLGSRLRNCLPPSGCHSFIILFLFSGHHSWAYMLTQLYCCSRSEPQFYDLVRNQVVLKGKWIYWSLTVLHTILHVSVLWVSFLL